MLSAIPRTIAIFNSCTMCTIRLPTIYSYYICIAIYECVIFFNNKYYWWPFLQFPNTNASHFGTYGTLGMTPGLMSPNANTADQYSVTKPRMRICFDPETEIPKLQKWFAENNHPTRQQVTFK